MVNININKFKWNLNQIIEMVQRTLDGESNDLLCLAIKWFFAFLFFKRGIVFWIDNLSK